MRLPAMKAEESRFRRCPLPRWRLRGLNCAATSGAGRGRREKCYEWLWAACRRW